VDRSRALLGVGATLAGVGSVRLAYNERRLYEVRTNGRIAGPRQRGLTSATVVWKSETDQPVVAFTFDDGPDPRYTPGVLEALAARDVPATFFMQGSNVDEHPDLARRVADRHAVGNHTYNHPDLANASVSTARRELERAHESIETVTGLEATLFRPPYGHISGAATLQAAQLGYDIMLWSQRIDSRATPESNVERLGERMTPGDVVLGHDGGTLPNETVVDCLPELLAVLADQGYDFVTLPELLDLDLDQDA
jgi:peptidoglycan-N-acetylglucosamine deacetylase